MKKLLSLGFAVILTLALCIGLASCNEVNFEIKFMVDGEVYHTIRTGGGEAITLPDNPTKDGSTFGGWYWDKDTWQQPFTANSLLDAPLSSDMSVYAKWNCVHIPAAPVTENLVDSTCKAEGSYDSVVYCSVCDEKLSSTPVTVPKKAHTEVNHIAKAPTCTEIGWDAYVTCTNCDYTTYVEKGKIDHSYSETLSSNATHHYNECVCGDKKNEALHISSGAPTSTKDEVCTVCGYVIANAVGIKFNTLTASGNRVYGKVSNNTEFYSFIGEVVALGNAKYIVSTDISGTNEIPAKAIALNIGDNTVYITEYINNEPTNIYIVTIRRKPMYEVTFNTNGGSAVGSLTVEEDAVITAPATIKTGYTFVSWDYDFTKPIIKDTNTTASWQANKDTAYKVEYYLENLDKNGYELKETLNLKGTTDTTATAEQKVIEHFTFNSAKSIMSGNIDANGSQVLKVYYTRNKYTISNANSGYGSISKSGSFAYDYLIENIATPNLGYEFIGWYSNDILISTSPTYAFNISGNIEARFALKSEMQKFNFTSNATTCSITGIKDKTVTEIVVPDYVTNISKGAFSGCSKLRSVTIGNGVTTIGYEAFYYCYSLTSVTIPDSVTSIGNYAFQCCYKLVEVYNLSSHITIEAGKASNGYVGYYALGIYTSASAQSKLHTTSDGYIFYEDGNTVYLVDYTGNSTALTLPDKYNGKNYAINKYAFRGNDKITSVTIPDSVTTIGDSAFYHCTSLTSVTIDNSVTSIGDWAFYDCSKLTSVTIPDSVTSIGSSAFSGCDSLTSVTIPDSVTSIGSSAFSGCDSLTSVTIPNSVKTIRNYAFAHCSSLASVTIPDSVTSIGDYAFQYCSKLTSITIPNSVTSIGSGAFYHCTSLTSVTIGNGVTSIGYSVFSACISLTSITIPNSVTSIGGNAFAHCSSLTSVTIPDSVTSIGDYAFMDCNSLTSVTIPDSVTSIGSSAFSGCSSLTSVTIPDSVISIGSGVLSGCSKLENLTIPFVGSSKSATSASSSTLFGYIFGDSSYDGGVATKQYYSGSSYATYYIPSTLKSVTITGGNILDRAFCNCDSLTSVTIGNSVTFIGDYAFRYCSKLTSVTIGNSVTTIGSYAFMDCNSLTSVTIPDSVTSIGYYAFSGCDSLNFSAYDNAYYIGNESNPYLVLIKAKDTSIASCSINPNTKLICYRAFSGCTSLISVTIPDSVTYIGDWAFFNCDSLTSVTIPDSVTYIGSYAFYDCDSLTSVTFKIPNGWWRSTSSSATSGTNITNLSNTSTAATYLRSTYDDYYWKRG